MVKGSSSKAMDKSKKQKGTSSNPTNDVKIETFVPKRDHDPRDLRSWAKRTGFVSLFSGESTASTSNTRNNLRNERVGNDSIEERENDGNRKRGETDAEIQPLDVLGSINEERRVGVDENGNNGGGNEFHEGQNMEFNGENEGGLYGKSPNLEDPILRRQPKVFKVKSGILDNPGFVPVIYYGFQHYFSIAGSLVLIPLIMVPAMGGTDKDTANVVSTVLLVSGITTLLHSFLGTRLPLKFRYIMRELQGAIMIGSLFQCMLGFSGLMSLLLRLINPVVVAPTMAAVGLAFFSYGFPQAGSCVEISIPLIVLLLFFTLVPLSIMIVWTYALFLTVGGAYNFKGCSPNIPSSNILVDACIKHAYTMKHCRTDVSDAWSTSAWVRIPYPLQWGIPIFRFRTSIIMIIVSLVSSVDSVGTLSSRMVATYYSASLKVNSKPPTPGIVTRGIGMEGFCSLLAGLWGTGTGSTTLTENVHTISITEVANRKGVQLGAVLLILLSFIGKVGGILASIPLALAASVLCFIWALTVALGLLNLQFTQASSVRNMGIVGVSLFLGLSIPAYFQQFQPEINLILPSYLIPYAAASNGPIHTGNKQFDFAMNALLSMNMVVSFLIAFVLDNTVPGTKQERGVYKWSTSEDLATDASSQASYKFPSGVSRACCWAKCLGV
uniref:Nucleobase-ascorbate transporter 11 n=1 Tax=Chenopodium quinoa TaxID=63459 RepID=A0A803KXB1_CHEQI